MIGAIIRMALRFRLLVLLVAAGVVVLGVARLTSAPADTLPEFTAPVVTIQTESLGLSAAEVEQLITVPMEQDLLNGVKGVETIRSHSVPGLSSIEMVFARGTDLLRDRQLVQERLTQAYVLPNVAKPPQMLQPTSSTNRVMVVGLQSRRLSAIDLSVLARWTIRPRLMGIPGVANVSIWGLRDRQLQVLVNPAELAANKVTLAQVISTAGNAQLVSPLSYLNASTPGTGGFIDTPNQRLSVRHILPFGEPRNLAEVPVDQSRDLDIGDVATVVEGHQPLIGDAVFAGYAGGSAGPGGGGGPPASGGPSGSGGAGLLVAIDKLPGASTLGVTHAVEQALAELRPGLSGVTVDASVFRPATYVRDGLHNVAVALAVAAALLLLVLIVLRRPWRTILVALVTISVSMLAAATVLDLLGYSFNALTFAGFGVALAVLIDFALAGGGETRDSIGFAGLIALIMAAPFFLARGTTGSFIHSGVLAYGLAVLASLILALTLTPALGSLLGANPAGAWPRRPDGLAGRARGAYRHRLETLPRLPRLAAVAVCVPGLALLAIAPALGEPQPPTFKDRDVLVRLHGRPGMSLPEMDRLAGRTLAAISRLPETQNVTAAVGRAVSSGEVGESNSGQLWVSIKPGADYQRTLGAIRGLAAGLPGVASSLETYESDRSSGVLSRPSDPPVVRIYGQDYGVLARSADQVRRAVAGVPGVRGASVLLPQQEPTLQVQVDLQRAQQYDIKPGDVRRSVATLLSGLTVGNFFQQQKVFDVVVRGTGTTQDSVASVRNLLIDTPGGGHVRLGQLAGVSIAPNPIDITHDAVSRFVDVDVNVAGNPEAVRPAIGRRIAQLQFPLEYHAELLAGPSAPATSAARFLSYLIAAALAVFLLLQAAFGSWRLAAVVFTTLPLATIGGILAAMAIGEQSSLGAACGLLAVLVVAARQSLVLLMPLRRLQHEGASAQEAMIVAAAERFTPTVVSMLAIAAAALPFVVMGDVAGNEILHPLAVVILGGMVTTALVALLITPVVYLGLGLQTAGDAVPRITRSRPPEAHPQEV